MLVNPLYTATIEQTYHNLYVTNNIRYAWISAGLADYALRAAKANVAMLYIKIENKLILRYLQIFLIRISYPSRKYNI